MNLEALSSGARDRWVAASLRDVVLQAAYLYDAFYADPDGPLAYFPEVTRREKSQAVARLCMVARVFRDKPGYDVDWDE